MKNLTTLVTPNEIDAYVLGLWKSDIFRESHRSGGFIAKQVERFAYLPRLFADMSNERLEKAHFSTWWNVIMRRDYDNAVVSDLYYLHEMTHAATMPYFQDIGRQAFDEKMQRNELEASVLSEIAIYLEMPELRAKSFPHAIYADRFLNDPQMAAIWKVNHKVALETLRFLRRDVMVSKPTEAMDLTEQWIRRFAEQNRVYSVVWADRYREIERQMALLIRGVAVSEMRREAITLYRHWLEGEAAKDGADNVPFRQEAELFAPFYWSNKAQYEAAMKSESVC